MSEQFKPETNEALLGQVRTVLTDIYLTTPEDIRTSRRRIYYSPLDLRLDSIRLLDLYDFAWRPRRSVGFFLCSQLSYPLKRLLISKPNLEDGIDSELYKTALEIIEDFFECLEYRDRLRKHIKTQRKIMDQCRAGFFYVLVFKYGKQCAECKSKRKKLYIDHIKPLAHWGLSEFTNLQLLCFGCNSKKSSRYIETEKASSWLAPR